MFAGASLAMAAPRGGGHFSPGAMRAGPGINRPGIVSRPGMMHRPGSSTWNGQRWSGNWRGRNWNGRNWNGWKGDWRFHRHFNKIVFIGDFGFPWWWGWGWGPWWWDWGYPNLLPILLSIRRLSLLWLLRLRLWLLWGWPALPEPDPVKSCWITAATGAGWLLPWGHWRHFGTSNAPRNSRLRTRPRIRLSVFSS